MDPKRLPEFMISRKPEGRKRQGRPWRTWKDGIYTVVSERGLRMGERNNRREWDMEVGRRRQNRIYECVYIYIYHRNRKYA